MVPSHHPSVLNEPLTLPKNTGLAHPNDTTA